MTAWRSVVALSGGVGGARLLRGLARALPGDALTAVVNTGDDFEHWGLHVSPDVDTVMYTLAGLAHEERGWGLATETFVALEAMRVFGEDGWFAIGDRDLATHLSRTRGLARGETLTEVTARLCGALGVAPRVLPMSDQRCCTVIDTKDHGALTFQTWFVRHRAEPAVKAVRFEGDARATPAVLEAIDRAELVIIGPSNPYVSIDPILSLPGVRAALFARPVVAVSPIVGGRAIKGPLATMIPQLTGAPPSAAAIARHYPELRALVVEQGEPPLDICTLATSTVMRSAADSERLAREVLELGRACR
ncbi:MAG TPA: 2-phospho-L-lactate transferase [Polyangiaceae bacterium]|jgi:LPPG:FO 2-phospho-L-lactate transferase